MKMLLYRLRRNLPEANTINDIVICDDNSVGDDTDGFINYFDFDSQIRPYTG